MLAFYIVGGIIGYLLVSVVVGGFLIRYTTMDANNDEAVLIFFAALFWPLTLVATLLYWFGKGFIGSSKHIASRLK
jgi:hypothetical protein